MAPKDTNTFTDLEVWENDLLLFKHHCKGHLTEEGLKARSSSYASRHTVAHGVSMSAFSNIASKDQLEKICKDGADELETTGQKVYTTVDNAKTTTTDADDWLQLIEGGRDNAQRESGIIIDDSFDKAINHIRTQPAGDRVTLVNIFTGGFALVQNFWGKVLGSIVDLVGQIAQFLRKIFDGIVQGVNFIKNGARNAVSAIGNFFRR